jgi:hypothetical protein
LPWGVGLKAANIVLNGSKKANVGIPEVPMKMVVVPMSSRSEGTSNLFSLKPSEAARMNYWTCIFPRISDPTCSAHL